MNKPKKKVTDIAGIIFVSVLYVCVVSVAVAGTVALVRLML